MKLNYISFLLTSDDLSFRIDRSQKNFFELCFVIYVFVSEILVRTNICIYIFDKDDT